MPLPKDDPFAALGAVMEDEISMPELTAQVKDDPFSELGAETPEQFISSRVEDYEFDPVSYAIESGDKETAREIAWRRKQIPMTLERFGGLAKRFGSAAVDLVKDFGGGLGDIGYDTFIISEGPDSTFWQEQGIDRNTAVSIIEKAKTQQLLRAQLIEEHGGTFLGKIFGQEGILGGTGRRLGQAALGVASYAPGLFGTDEETLTNAIGSIEEDIDDREADPRTYFNRRFDSNVDHARKAMEIEQGKVQDDGLVAKGLGALDYAGQRFAGAAPEEIQEYKPSENFASAEELEAAGAPIDTDSVRRGSVAADPINLAPLHIPGAGKLLNPVAGAGLRAVAAPIALAEKIPIKVGRTAKYALGGAAGIGAAHIGAHYAGHKLFSDPVGALKGLGIAAATVGSAYVGAKGAKLVGHVLDNAGKKLISPRFVSAAEREAAEGIIAANKGGQGGQLSAFDPRLLRADAERALTRIPMGAASAPVVMAPLNAAISESPEEFAQLEGGVFGFGSLAGVMGYNPVRGFRPDTVQALDVVLRDQGAKKRYGTPLDAAHEAFMATAPEWVQNGVNAYRGFFDGFQLPGGQEPKIYVLPGSEFAAEVARRDGNVTPELAQRQRGYKDKDGTALINGDFASEAPSILGHEAGGHIAQAIIELYAPDIGRQLQGAAYDSLLTESGRPTPKLRKFVDSYNRSFDPTGRKKGIETTDQAIQEWLAEQGRAVLSGGPAKFSAPPGLRETITDNLGDYFQQLFGTKRKFDREEIPVLAREYRDMLFELGRLRGTHPNPEVARTESATPPAPEPTATRSVPESAPAATPAAEAPAPSVPAPAPRGDAFADVGTQQSTVREARNGYVRENGMEPSAVRANKKKGTEGKSADEVMAEREAEFDATLGELTQFARDNNLLLPDSAVELRQMVFEWMLNADAYRQRYGRQEATEPARTDRIEEVREGDPEPGEFVVHPEEQAALSERGWTPEEIGAMPLHQVEAELQAHARGEPPIEGSARTQPVEAPDLSTFAPPAAEAASVEPAPLRPQAEDSDPNATQRTETSDSSVRGDEGALEQRPDSDAPERASEVPAATEETITQALADADARAETRSAKVRGGKKRSAEEIKAEISREERLSALTSLLPRDGEGLRRVENPATGEVVFQGDVDPSNPVHAAILAEFGYTPGHISTLLGLQGRKGKGLWVRDYNAAEQEGHETGEGLDLSSDKRGKEYQASPTGAAGQRRGSTTKQDKPFTPYEVVLSDKGALIRGFDHDKFLANMRSILDSASEQGIETGLPEKGSARDSVIADAFRKVAENHANGWKGDGSAPLKVFPDTGIAQNLDYIGQSVDARLAEVINMAMHIRAARPPKPPRGKEPTELARKRFAAASATAKESQGLASLNEGFLNPETGETNAFRELMEAAGFETDKQLKGTISNLRPDLIEGGIHDTPTHGRSVHAHGFDIPPADFTVSGTPRKKPTSAGFMPGDGELQRGQLEEFRSETQPSIKSKVQDEVKFVQPERAKRRKDVVVSISIPAFDKAFSRDKDFYVGPDGEGAIKGRREGFQDFLERGRYEPETGGYARQPIEMPEVTIQKDGTPSFINGRHRYSVFRDGGRESIPVSMDAESAARAKELGLTDSGGQFMPGEPMRVYHGSIGGKVPSDWGKRDIAFFTPDQSIAKEYAGERGEVGEFDITLTNPLEISSPKELLDLLPQDLQERHGDSRYSWEVLRDKDLPELFEDTEVIEHLRDELGYDGLVIHDDLVTRNGRLEEHGVPSYAVFYKEDIAPARAAAFMPSDQPRKTWFMRDGKRVYQRRGKDGTFQPKGQTLAKPPVSAIPSEDRSQLEDFSP